MMMMMMMGNSHTREDRNAKAWAFGPLEHGIFHHHRLFYRYFIVYKEVFNSNSGIRAKG